MWKARREPLLMRFNTLFNPREGLVAKTDEVRDDRNKSSNAETSSSKKASHISSRRDLGAVRNSKLDRISGAPITRRLTIQLKTIKVVHVHADEVTPQPPLHTAPLSGHRVLRSVPPRSGRRNVSKNMPSVFQPTTGASLRRKRLVHGVNAHNPGRTSRTSRTSRVSTRSISTRKTCTRNTSRISRVSRTKKASIRLIAPKPLNRLKSVLPDVPHPKPKGDEMWLLRRLREVEEINSKVLGKVKSFRVGDFHEPKAVASSVRFTVTPSKASHRSKRFKQRSKIIDETVDAFQSLTAKRIQRIFAEPASAWETD